MDYRRGDDEWQTRVEGAFRRGKQSLRLFIGTLPGIICILMPEGRIEHGARQVLDYCGTTLKELQRFGITDAIHPDDSTRGQHVAQILWRYRVQSASVVNNLKSRTSQRGSVRPWPQII